MENAPSTNETDTLRHAVRQLHSEGLIITTPKAIKKLLDEQNKPYLTTEEALKFLGVSIDQFKKLRKDPNTHIFIYEDGGAGRGNSHLYWKGSLELELWRIQQQKRQKIGK
jgi:hypothetical protein